MRYNILNIAAAITATFLMVACADEKTPETPADTASISLSAESVTFLKDGTLADGSLSSVTVESTGEWRLIGKDTWCHPDRTSGENGDAVTFSADGNIGTAEIRTEEFSFVCGDKTAKLYVVQKADDLLTFFKDHYDVARDGYRIGVNVSSNKQVTWSVPEEYADWITHVEGEDIVASDVYAFYFDIAETDEYETREASISFTAGETTKNITIVQDKKLLLQMDGESSYLLEQGTPVEVTVKTNVAYNVSFSSGSVPSWLSYQPDPQAGVAPETITERTMTFTANAAAGDETRAEQVTLTSSDGSMSCTVAFIQRGSNVQIIEIPDPNFRQALADVGFVVTIGYDAPECEITSIGKTSTSLNVSGKNIESLEGLENFSRVEQLDCSNNNIKTVDFTNTRVYESTMGGNTSLKLKGNPWEEIICSRYINYINLESDSPDASLTGSNGETSTVLKISGSTIYGVKINNCPSLQILDLYECTSLFTYSGYCSIQGCVPDGLLKVYVAYGKKSGLSSLCTGVEIFETPSGL